MKKTNWIGIIAIVLVAVLTVGGLGFWSSGYKDWNYMEWFDKKESLNQDGGKIDNKVYPLPARLTFGVLSESTSVTVLATVYPENASNKGVNWSIAWKDNNSAWATGKNPYSYLSVTKAPENSRLATIELLQPFGEQIILKVTAQGGEFSNPTATCTIDYAARVEGTNMVLQADGGGVVEDNLISFDYLTDPRYEIMEHQITPVFGVGSIVDTYEVTDITVRPTEEFGTYFCNYAYENSHKYGAANLVIIPYSMLDSNYILTTGMFVNNYFRGAGGSYIDYFNTQKLLWDALKNYQGTSLLDVTVGFNGYYEGGEYYCIEANYTLNLGSLNLFVYTTSVVLDQTELVI